jgi:hypothetical protein
VTMPHSGFVRALCLFIVGTSLVSYGQTPTHGGLVLVGYQGWFRCPGDGAPLNSWAHWSKGDPVPSTMAVDLYPDTSELDKASLCKLPSATINGKPAYLFSSFPYATTDKHFAWMQSYGIDGVLLQRYINHIGELRGEHDRVLKNVREAAEKHGRVFAVEYDLSGAHLQVVFDQLQSDWNYLSDELKLPSSPAYLRLNGKPVVALWGLGFGDENHIDDPQLALKIIDWFKRTKHVTVIGGVPAGWGSLSGDSVHNPAWKRVYAELDVVQPWTVGRYKTPQAADQWKSSHLVPDQALARSNHQLYMPVIFPGFSWHNLIEASPGNQIPRLGGKFMWAQAYNARVVGAPLLMIAMFDEVNEGTAIFKAVQHRDQAPKPGYWLTLDADGNSLPSDWYLRVTQEISRMFHGEIEPTANLPISP